jgi:hypothetical protein
MSATTRTHVMPAERNGGGYCLELGFDGEVQGQRADFRPELPLVVYW